MKRILVLIGLAVIISAVCAPARVLDRAPVITDNEVTTQDCYYTGGVKLPTYRYEVLHRGYVRECMPGDVYVTLPIQVWEVADTVTGEVIRITVRTADVGKIPPVVLE